MDIKVHLDSKPGMFSMYRFDESHLFIKSKKTGKVTSHERKDFKCFAGNQKVPWWLQEMFNSKNIHPIQKKFNAYLRAGNINAIEILLNSL